MRLREYLFFEEIKLKDFAKLVDYSPEHIGMIARGKYNPSKKLARRIEAATNGKVTIEELMAGKKSKKQTTN